MYLGLHLAVPIICLTAYFSLWGWHGFMTYHGLCIAIVLFILSVPIHEIIHYTCFVAFNGASRRNVHFHFEKTNLVPYVTCNERISAGRYKMAALAPFMVIGLPLSLYGLLRENSTAELTGILAILGCSGDLIMYSLSSRVRNSAIVWRFSTEAGQKIVKVGFNIESNFP